MIQKKNNFVGPPPEYPIKPIGPLRPKNNINFNYNDNNFTNNNNNNSKINNNKDKKSKPPNKPFNINDPDLNGLTHPFENPFFT